MPEPEQTHLSDSLLGAPHPEDPDGLQTLSREGQENRPRSGRVEEQIVPSFQLLLA